MGDCISVRDMVLAEGGSQCGSFEPVCFSCNIDKKSKPQDSFEEGRQKVSQEFGGELSRKCSNCKGKKGSDYSVQGLFDLGSMAGLKGVCNITES